MAVTVRIDHNNHSAHKEGTRVNVADGHLIISRGNGSPSEVVAVYAPGHWLSVERDQDKS